jgi:hypothetical protein
MPSAFAGAKKLEEPAMTARTTFTLMGCRALCAAAIALLQACGGGNSDDPPTVAPPKIGVAPVSSTTVSGGAATFSVTVSGSGLSFQWQLSLNQGATWADISGANAAQYTIAAVQYALNGNRYRVVVSGGGSSVTSDPVTLTVACSVLAPRLGGKAYYDACLNVTYLADANLPATLPLGVAGIQADGAMTWPTAKAWVQALNASAYLGYADWRLPVVRPQNGSALQLNGTDLQGRTGQLDLGYNISAAGTRYAASKASELPFLFYNQLGGLADYATDGTARTNVSNAGLPYFNHLSLANAYWTSTPYGADGAFAFNFAHGTQYAFVATASGWRYNLLLMRDGDVGAGGGGGGGGSVADVCQPPQALPTGTVIEADTVVGTLTVTSRLTVAGPATFDGHSTTQVDIDTSFANITAHEFGSWNAATHALTQYGVTTRTASADGLTVQDVKAVATPPAVDTRYALAPGGSLTQSTTSVQTETLTLNGVPQAPTTKTETETSTVMFSGMETHVVPAGAFHACKYIETDSRGTTARWVMAGYGVDLRSVTGSSTSIVTAVRVNGVPLTHFP